MNLFRKIKDYFTTKTEWEEIRYLAPDPFTGKHIIIKTEGYTDWRGDTITKTSVDSIINPFNQDEETFF